MGILLVPLHLTTVPGLGVDLDRDLKSRRFRLEPICRAGHDSAAPCPRCCSGEAHTPLEWCKAARDDRKRRGRVGTTRGTENLIPL